MREPTRIDPKLPVEAVKTFQIAAPLSTHFRPSTCEEAGCGKHREGWLSLIDEGTDLGKKQAWYIRNQSGRQFKEDRNQMPGLTAFIFEPGQQCFAQHKTRLDRPEFYIVRDGDWRGNPTGQRRQHANADDFVDDFANHQQVLADAIQEG